MTKRQAEQYSMTRERLISIGISSDDVDTLFRIQSTLHHWGEMECGDGNDYCSWAIERDEQTEKPYRCVYPHDGKMRRYPIADREKGALRRLATIMAKYPTLLAYHQQDPRGCSLYVMAKTDLGDFKADQVYNRGIAVCY